MARKNHRSDRYAKTRRDDDWGKKLFQKLQHEKLKKSSKKAVSAGK